jgi:hypothetical protein
MLVKQCNHYLINTVDHRPNTNTSPFRHILNTNGITIVASMVEEYSKLDRHGELGVVGIVMKNVVVRNLIKDVIKDFWINT